MLRDAFAHHVWATLRVIESCRRLDAAQLAAAAPGTFGSIIDTLRHIVGADRAYLSLIGGGRVPTIDEDHMDLDDLRHAMEEDGAGWTVVVESEPDPDAVLVRHRDDGSESHAPLGIRLAQVLHHGSDHRSQVCTILTTLGVDPPAIDVWDFGADRGSVVEVRPTS